MPCPPGRGMDLNPELLSAIDRLCVGLVVQCMFQCRVHNLNHTISQFLTHKVKQGTVCTIDSWHMNKKGCPPENSHSPNSNVFIPHWNPTARMQTHKANAGQRKLGDTVFAFVPIHRHLFCTGKMVRTLGITRAGAGEGTRALPNVAGLACAALHYGVQYAI